MNRMKSKISSPPSSLLAQSSVKSLLLKHEILSPECDLFRACLPRRVYVKRVGRMMAVVVGVGAGCWWWRVKEIVGGVLMIITILALIFMLSRVIEERILFIRGLGVQYSVVNGFKQETTTFYPFERIKSFYIFESFDGLKVGHFFAIKLRMADNEKEGDADLDSDHCDDSDSDAGCVVLFEDMRPPVEFLKRVYRKFTETKSS